MDRQPDLFATDPAPWEIDDQRDILLATVVFPQAPVGEFDYRVPESLRERVQVGCRLRVPLGKSNRGVMGYCVKLDRRGVGSRRIKDILSLIDDVPFLSASLLELTRWMADYYVSPLGAILETVVPASVRGAAGTRDTTFLSVPTNVVARITQLKLPPRQAEVLRFVAASVDPVRIGDVVSSVGCTTGPINELRRKGLIVAEKRRVHTGQFTEQAVERSTPWTLNGDQQLALDSVREHLLASRHKTVLMHGVTGSGKTEVYIRAIDEVIGFGRQAIVLVPEISLTPQTRRRFRSRFDNVAVLHSNLSAAERHWQWRRIARGEVQVVVGARSAIFAPTPHLGLIVVDEEHEPSFKQDTNPRYHARDIAIQRAQREQIPLILGSATPSLESWHRARQGEFQLVSMPRRALDRPLPDVKIVDLRTEKLSGARTALSRPLRQAMDRELADGGQVILLLNRRGFATHIQCPACGEVVRCPECDIALTHHRDVEQVLCHYCDYHVDTPPNCPKCRFSGIRFGGLGTQRLEAEIRAAFPDARCLRMDSDTMRGTGSHEEALEKFRRGDVQILFGTQMIAKGLDFPNVTLVGVVNADTALHLPDFRAGERTFQLVTQVAGRTGRGERGGRVLVQTFAPDDPVIQAAARHDYVAFADRALPERQEFFYPPWSSVIRLVFRSELDQQLESFAQCVCNKLRQSIETTAGRTRILGPVPAPIQKLRGKFRFHTLVQTSDADAVRRVLADLRSEFPSGRECEWIIDVDPLSML